MSGADFINTSLGDYDYANYYNEGDWTVCKNSTPEFWSYGPVFLPILYSLVFILGLIGNGLVVAVFAKHSSQINMTDICLLNLAISDLFFVLSMPFYSHSASSRNWIFGTFMCHLISILYLVGFYGGVFCVIVMTLDRYVVIMHAHTLARHRRTRLGVAVTALVWVLSFFISLPSMASLQLQEDQRCSVWLCEIFSERNTKRDYVILSNNVFGLLIPLLVMAVCYSRVLPSLMAMRSTKRYRAVKLVIIIVVVFFLFWTPYNIALFLSYYRDKNENFGANSEFDLPLFIQITEAIAFTHCCLNPIIYAFVGQKFARRAVGLLHAWMPCVFRRVPRDPVCSSRRCSVGTMSSEATSTFLTP
ncbi:C-C chemokine receptor type 1 [Gadus morhua]|uniref:C-C chemokine receptor type 1 n=1 Tax=Gadus morhua TaxID=8049 RepID=UPI0011B81CB8|nr:C-C chemokine receptor type 1-like [Gadus morhua]